jgi:hypothetical protein
VSVLYYSLALFPIGYALFQAPIRLSRLGFDSLPYSAPGLRVHPQPGVGGQVWFAFLVGVGSPGWVGKTSQGLVEMQATAFFPACAGASFGALLGVWVGVNIPPLSIPHLVDAGGDS